MLAAYTTLQNAQKVKELLIKKEVLHPEYLPVKELDFLYFPITQKVALSGAKIVNTKFSFPQRRQQQSVEEILKRKLTKKELEILPKSQEIVGTVLILEIPEELQRKEKAIAEAYLAFNKHIKTVVRKSAVHSGVYRTRKLKFLAGKNTKETVHVESGLRMNVNLEKMYFTSRLGNERLRIAQSVKKGEEILVMFSGAGPYALVLAKQSSAKKVYGIEINPLAHRYAVDNIVLNKLSDKVNLYLGDVCEVAPKLRKKFDRIVMPLPKTGKEFLPAALAASKKGTTIHFYAFLSEKEINAEGMRIKKLCAEYKHPVRVIRKVKCGQFSPGTFRVSFDLKVL